MNHQQRVEAFIELGKVLGSVASAAEGTDWDDAIRKAGHHNAWFTDENVRLALRGLSRMLAAEKLHKWLAAYGDIADSPEPKTVGIIMAGNIPLVGFHDMMTVLITGHRAMIRTSSQDELLPRKLVETLVSIEPAFADCIEFSEGRMTGFTHIIATGSSNSSRYFEYYFSRYPSIIRGNRNSVAVITGQETEDELLALGKDVFRFFGLGCRNVSKLFVQRNVDIVALLRHFEGWEHIGGHHKYHNNYDYHKAIFLVEKMKHLDTGFLLVRQEQALACPVSVLHYEMFDALDEVKSKLLRDADAIQCVVASEGTGIANAVPFGKSQEPEAWDYADGVDTVEFLLEREATTA
ncbi:MAG: acyl-CoA reductase [Flavobacteriales bacterium]|nr:acyl-CoA reductase [Flavobacteriales bacterium]